MLYSERKGGLTENSTWGYEQFHELPPGKSANHHKRFQSCQMLLYINRVLNGTER